MAQKTNAADMAETSICHTVNRFKHSGKSAVPLPMNDVKEGRSTKPTLGMDASPTKTKTMDRAFGRTHA